jgi:hypothetical protein
MRKRGLFAAASGNGFVVVSAQSLRILQHGPIFDGRGKVFFAALGVPAPSNSDTLALVGLALGSVSGCPKDGEAPTAKAFGSSAVP